MSIEEALTAELDLDATIKKDIVLGLSLCNQTHLAFVGYVDNKYFFCQYPITFNSIFKKMNALKLPKRISVKGVQKNPKS